MSREISAKALGSFLRLVLADGSCCIICKGTGVVVIEQMVFVFVKGLRVVSQVSTSNNTSNHEVRRLGKRHVLTQSEHGNFDASKQGDSRNCCLFSTLANIVQY